MKFDVEQKRHNHRWSSNGQKSSTSPSICLKGIILATVIHKSWLPLLYPNDFGFKCARQKPLIWAVSLDLPSPFLFFQFPFLPSCRRNICFDLSLYVSLYSCIYLYLFTWYIEIRDTKRQAFIWDPVDRTFQKKIFKGTTWHATPISHLA